MPRGKCLAPFVWNFGPDADLGSTSRKDDTSENHRAAIYGLRWASCGTISGSVVFVGINRFGARLTQHALLRTYDFSLLHIFGYISCFDGGTVCREDTSFFRLTVLFSFHGVTNCCIQALC